MSKEKISQATLSRAAAYIRESTEEQDKGYSPDNQKETILRYARQNGIEVVEWYKDLFTGRSAEKRIDFQRMIADAMMKKFDVILIFHSSRFARNVEESQQYKKLLRNKLGINVVSVTQNFGDPDDPGSFLNEGINELFDEHVSRNIGFWVGTSLMAKRQKGYQLGNPPLGYYKKKIGYDKERDRVMYEGVWRVETDEAKLVNQIFNLYIGGNMSFADIAAELNKNGGKTKHGHPFTYSSIKDTLNNRSYLGYTYSPRRNYPELRAKHKPIITEELFNKAQEVLNDRRRSKGRSTAKHRFYFLQSLVFCYGCYKHLKGKENNPSARLLPKMYCVTQPSDGKEYYSYACKYRRENHSCKQKSVKCETIDDEVSTYLEGFTLPKDVIEDTISQVREMIQSAKKTPDMVGRIKRLEEKKKKIEFIFTNTSELSEEQYLGKLEEVNIELNKYSQFDRVASNARREEEFIKKTERLLGDFKSLWDTFDKVERRRWAMMTLRRVWVKDGKVYAIEPQEEYKPLFVAHREVLGRAGSNP